MNYLGMFNFPSACKVINSYKILVNVFIVFNIRMNNITSGMLVNKIGQKWH